MHALRLEVLHVPEPSALLLVGVQDTVTPGHHQGVLLFRVGNSQHKGVVAVVRSHLQLYLGLGVEELDAFAAHFDDTHQVQRGVVVHLSEEALVEVAIDRLADLVPARLVGVREFHDFGRGELLVLRALLALLAHHCVDDVLGELRPFHVLVAMMSISWKR